MTSGLSGTVSFRAARMYLERWDSEHTMGLNNYQYYVGVPYYNYRIMGPETLFKFLRPLYYNLQCHGDLKCA